MIQLDTRYSTQCLRKKRYSSSIFAMNVARNCERKRQTKLKTYHCPFCFGYHLARE